MGAVQKPLGPVVKHLPGGSQGQFVPLPVEQPNPQLLFQLPHLGAEGRLGHEEGPGSGGNAALLDDG